MLLNRFIIVARTTCTERLFNFLLHIYLSIYLYKRELSLSWWSHLGFHVGKLVSSCSTRVPYEFHLICFVMGLILGILLILYGSLCYTNLDHLNKVMVREHTFFAVSVLLRFIYLSDNQKKSAKRYKIMLYPIVVFNKIISECIPSLLHFFRSSTIKRYILFREKNHQVNPLNHRLFLKKNHGRKICNFNYFWRLLLRLILLDQFLDSVSSSLYKILV